jgi:FMN phosphatase YigB (HAD superfamily)
MPPTLVESHEQLLTQLQGLARVVFDLDGTLYDTRDFEYPALDAIVEWLRQRSAMPLAGLPAALKARRHADRHRPRLFDDLLPTVGLPAEWGAECAARFRSYPATELARAQNLGGALRALRLRGCLLALVTNGRPDLQQRKLQQLGLEGIFDACIYCDPSCPDQLKPAPWAWQQLQRWREGLPSGYVGDDPVDAAFAAAGDARYFEFVFRSSNYGN